LWLRRGRRRGTRASSGGGAFLFLWRAGADVGKILAHAHLPEKNGSFENVITRRAAAVTPFSLDVGASIFGVDLLTVTIDAAIGSVNARAPLDHS